MAAEFCDVSGRDGIREEEEKTRTSTSGTDEEKSCMTVAERLRQYRERQEMIQRRGIETLREMDARAEEFRREQERERRRAMKDSRTREEEQRTSVQERRRKLLEEEHERRLLKLQKLWESNRRTDESRRRRRKKAAGRFSFGSGAMSDGTLSSGGRTPIRPYRPHSIPGQVPNYALPTVASQIRAARWTDTGLNGQLVTVCYRCRSLSPLSHRRSRSAEPAPRSGHPALKMTTADHPLTRTSTALSSRPLPGPMSRPLSSSGSIFPSHPSSIPSSTKATPHSLKTRHDHVTEPETKSAEGEEAKRKSFLPNRKYQTTRSRRPREPSSEFRLFSFRHHGDTASMTVARGLQTPNRSKVETIQRSKQLKPTQTKSCRESGSRNATKQPEVAIKPPRTAKTDSDVSSGATAMDKGRVAMETDLDTLETRAVYRKRVVANGDAQTREDPVSKKLSSTGGVEAAPKNGPSAAPVAKLDRPTDFPPEQRNNFGMAVEGRRKDLETVEDVRDDLWTEDGATSETISDGTSLEQFLDDSASLSEATDDLDPTRRSLGQRELAHLLPVSHLLKRREDLPEGEEETVEIYEELQVVEEVEVRRKDATELTVTLEKIVTEETLEILCPAPGDDHDARQISRASVSSI